MADGFNPGLVPGGANPSGSNYGGVPNPFGGMGPGLGGGQNPLVPTFPSQGQVPAPTSTMAPGASSMSPSGNPLSGTNLASTLGLGANGGSAHDFVAAMRKAGFSAGVAGELWNFLQSGAGFNQDALNALFQSMQPQIQRGEEDILEQFSGMGLRNGSPAGVAFGDYLGQVNANQMKAEFDMYNQAVSNYMNVLLAGKGQPPKSFFDNLMTYMQTMSSASASAAMAGGG